MKHKLIGLILLSVFLTACGDGDSLSDGGGDEATFCIRAEQVSPGVTQLTNICSYAVNLQTKGNPVLTVTADKTVGTRDFNPNDLAFIAFAACRAPSVPEDLEGATFSCS